MDKILYKYRADEVNTVKIFTNKKIWLSNAEGLNDPFECTIGEIASEWIEEQVKHMKYAQLMGFAFGLLQAAKTNSGFYDLNPKQAKEYEKKFRSQTFDEKYSSMRAFIRRKNGFELSKPDEIFINFDKQLSEVGIFSLSETYDNELLWAYYADSSKGISIGFEVIEGNKLSNPDHCLKVNYSDVRPTFNGVGFKNEVSFYRDKNVDKISFEDDTFKKAITTKKTTWQHEKEWRYIEEKAGSYNFPGKLVEIIFGLKCSEETRQKYRKLVKSHIENEVRFFEMIVDKNKLVRHLIT
jgi:hypothetical protein